MRLIILSIVVLLQTASFFGLLTAPLALANEPPIQSPSPAGSGGEAGTATGGQEPESPGAGPTIDEASGPPSETGEIQERGILPGVVAPNLQSNSPTQFSAPTLSLSAIRNAMRITSKSISVNLRIPANLPVTVPVEVSVAYNSSAQTQRQTKTYNAATGLVIGYREAEGDGKPRAMRLDITVRELVPNGKSFSVSKQFTITPLYRASISPLTFYMFTKCDTVGKSDITFQWLWPDRQFHEQKFDLGFGETKTVNLFSWGRVEFSTEANLSEPSVRFFERDPTLPGSPYHTPLGPSATALVSGPTKKFSFVLNEKAQGPPESPSGSTGCKAQISYRIDRNLMTFDQF